MIQSTRVTLFAKSMLDVRDTLHSLKVGGKVLWNGVNEVCRRLDLPTSVLIRHETITRSDALATADGRIPLDLVARKLPLGPFPLESQFSDALYRANVDAFVISILPDLTTHLVRNRKDGYLFLPYEWTAWSRADQEWLLELVEESPPPDDCASMTNYARIIERIRERSDAPILVYNVSSVVPGEHIYCYQGLMEVLSTRARRFNLALIELSQRMGVYVIDVDAIIARGGADRMKYDALHLTAEGCRAVAEDVVRALQDLDVLPPARGYA